MTQKVAGKMTSCKEFLLPEAVLHTRGGRPHLPTSRRSSMPPRKRAGRELARRGVAFLKNLKPRIRFRVGASVNRIIFKIYNFL